MKNISKDCNKFLIISILISAGFVVGIPLIISGAINSMYWIMGIGITLTVVGFYGSPLIWIAYAKKVTLKHLYNMLVCDGLNNVSDICNSCGYQRKDTINNINQLIRQRYLVGYTFVNNETITPITKPTSKQYKCPNCGASVTKTNNQNHCDYCNTDF